MTHDAEGTLANFPESLSELQLKFG